MVHVHCHATSFLGDDLHGSHDTCSSLLAKGRGVSMVTLASLLGREEHEEIYPGHMQRSWWPLLPSITEDHSTLDYGGKCDGHGYSKTRVYVMSIATPPPS